jgi:hypothetical protein
MKRFALTGLVLVNTLHGVAHAADEQTGHMPSQTATEATATTHAVLELVALAAAAQLVRSYKQTLSQSKRVLDGG